MTSKVNTTNTADKLKQKSQQNQQQSQPQQGNQTPAKQKEGGTLQTLMDKMEPQIRKAVPKQIGWERFTRIALSVYSQNDKLKECNPTSFIGAVMQSAQMGLEPNTPLGEAYIIPYGQNATFQIGYKGILSLAHRTGQYRAIYAQEVYPNDDFQYSYGLEKTIHHIPADVPEGDPIYYYAVYRLSNGGYDLVVWSTDKIKNHARRFSQALNGPRTSPWQTDFDSMAKKTVLKDVLKYAPKSIEFSRQIANDGTVVENLEHEPQQMENVIDIDSGGQQQEPEQQQGNQWW